MGSEPEPEPELVSARSLKETYDSVMADIERLVKNVEANNDYHHNRDAMKNYNAYCRLLSDTKTFAGTCSIEPAHHRTDM